MSVLLDIQKCAEWIEHHAYDAWILTHRSPDGDAFGSSYGLYYILKAMGRRARVICIDAFNEKYESLFDADMPDEEAFEPKCIISTDVADPMLLGENDKIDLKALFSNRVDLCIDHHESNKMYAQHTCLYPKASAACEVLYEILQKLPVKSNPAIIECLYVGILTDTGCFKFDNCSAKTHRIIADIMEQNPDLPFGQINHRVIDIKPYAQMKLESEIVNLAEFFEEGAICLIAVPNTLLQESGVASTKLEGIAGLSTNFKGVEIGITMRESEPNDFKISFRSTGDANVSRACQTIGGGGHVKAAGTRIHGSFEEVKQQILNAARQELSLLNHS